MGTTVGTKCAGNECSTKAEGTAEAEYSAEDRRKVSRRLTFPDETLPNESMELAEEPLWAGDKLKSVQEADSTITRLRKSVEEGKRPLAVELDGEGQDLRAMVQRWKELTVLDGILYRRGKHGLQAVIPGGLRVQIFHQMHGLAHVGGHLGRDRTYIRVRSRAWWPGYKNDLARWVKSCRSCQLAKPGPGRGRLPLVQERAGAPFERVALDLVGPLPPSKGGKKVSYSRLFF